MYKCTDCGANFDKPNVIKEDFGERWNVCPECGAVEFTEALQCKGCAEFFIEDRSKSFCDDCLEELRLRFSSVLHNNFSDDEVEALNVIFDGRNLE